MSSTTANTNSCQVFTVLPMGLTCVTNDVTTYNGTDGSMFLYITGGTSPYTIQWSNGASDVTFMSGLTTGTYTATVVDFYGDYTASTSCVIGQPAVSPTPTPTPTPSPTPAPSYPSNVCLTLTSSPYTQLEFDYQGTVNGYPSWSGTSGDVIYDTSNTRWVVSGYSSNNLRKLTTATVPTGTWTEFGTSQSWNMVTGTCVTQSLAMNVTTTDETCVGSSNGTVTVNAYGGTSPYTYSLDNITFVSSNIFFNLPSGNGTVYVKDSLGTIISQNFNLNVGSSPQTYTLNITTTTTVNSSATYNKSKTVNWTATVSPALPLGVSLTANIIVNNYFTDYYIGSQHASFTSGSTVLTSGNVTINGTTNGTTTGSGYRTCGGGLELGWENSGFTKTMNVTFQGGGSSGIITGTDTFTVSHSTPVSAICPVYGYNYYSVSSQNVTIDGRTNCGNASNSGGTNECVSTSPYPSGPGSGC